MPEGAAETVSRHDTAKVRTVSQHMPIADRRRAGSKVTHHYYYGVAMKAFLFVSLLVSSQAFAGGFNAQNDIDPFGFEQEAVASVKSRAEVGADAIAALRAGEIPSGELSAPTAQTMSSKSRAEVMADAIEAARLGLISHGEV
jgi:hypothetical protein